MSLYPPANMKVFDCKHVFLQQQSHPSLPNLYIAESLPAYVIGYLHRTIRYLNKPRPASTIESQQVKKLRHELARGMTKERREEVYNYVLGMTDLEKRAATEVYLARYPGFVLDGEGRLIFGDGYGLPMVDDNFLRKENRKCSIIQHAPPPTLSSTQGFKFRRSKSLTYDNASPEWYWKLSPILPQLWIRDANQITAKIVTDLEQDWLRYVNLSIPGKGDGAGLSTYTRSGRRKLEEEYGRLDEETRRAKEVALARYKNFVIRGVDGSLDYHTEEKVRGERSGGESGGIWKKIRERIQEMKIYDGKEK